MNKKRFYVYSYSTEKDGLFWIGKGKNNRINVSHIRSPYCHNVLEARKEEKIIIKKEKIFDGMTEADAFAWERNLIWFYEPKCNLTYGGEGASGFSHSKITKKKMSDAKRGIKFSDEHKKKLSDAKRNKKLSPEHRKKIGDGNRGKPHPGLSEKMIGKNHHFWGKHHTKESKEKMSEAHKGKTPSEETRKKLSEARLGLLAGEKHPTSKLTWKQVREIREKYIPYECSFRKLAEQYKVSTSTIQGVVKNKTWLDNETDKCYT